MNKAFVREDLGDDEDDLSEDATPLPSGSKNYITPAGYERLRTELTYLVNTERPGVVSVMPRAASNGDCFENGDYPRGEKRLREIDCRIRFLTYYIEKAEAVDVSLQGDNDQIFFGVTIIYANQRGEEKMITIVGMDKVDLDIGHVSWISSIARVLIKAHVDDTVSLRAPTGVEQIDILEAEYPPRIA